MKHTTTTRDLWLDMEAAFDSVLEDGLSYEFHQAAAAMLRVLAIRYDIYRPDNVILWLSDEANKAAAAKSRPD